MPKHIPGALMLAEIDSQASAWEGIFPLVLEQTDSLKDLFQSTEGTIFSGCGSGLNLATWALPFFQGQTGLKASAIPAADIYLFPEMVLPKKSKNAAILLSRSGRTTEVLRALEALHNNGIPVLGITCTGDSPLAAEADLALILDPVSEQAVAATRSFTGMVLACQVLAAIIANDQSFLEELHRLPTLGDSLLSHARSQGQEIGSRSDIQRYVCLGNGPLMGLAMEAQLKIKETTSLPVDSYPLLEFRHGPQSTVRPDMLIITLLSNRGYADELIFLRDMKTLGAVIWAVCEQSTLDLVHNTDYIFELNSGLSDRAVYPLYMPVLHYLAHTRSRVEGLNPDKPNNLSYWIDITS